MVSAMKLYEAEAFQPSPAQNSPLHPCAAQIAQLPCGTEAVSLSPLRTKPRT